MSQDGAPVPSIDLAKLARNGLLIAIVALVCAFAAGKGLERLLALPEGASLGTAQVEEPEGESVRRPRSREVARARSKKTYADPILRRNIFDSEAVGSTYAPESGESGRKTDLNVTLVATVVAEPAKYSSALIASGDGKKESYAIGYGIGDQLLDDAEILRIEQKKVIIRRSDGTIEYISMGDEGSKSSSRGAKKTEESADGVSKTGENSYAVDQSFMDDAMSNIDQLLSQVRATPHKGADGEIDGFRLSAIRRGSLLQKLGIKNGDVVHSVNGTPLTSTAGAMGAFQSFQSERSFSFDVTRRNKKQTFEYEIR